MVRRYILTAQCEDKTGIVSSVSTALAQNSATIIEATQHTDIEERQFFMRYEFSIPKDKIAILSAQLDTLAMKLDLTWDLIVQEQKKRIVLLATKETHCISDILHRAKYEDAPYEIVAIIANNEKMEELAAFYKLPFHFVSFNENTRDKSFLAIEQLIDEYHPDLIGLAKFMRIFPSELCVKYLGKLVNIHHSFLPSFVGAKPYHQAYQKGVKIIGATCHFVTADLDQGPIIEQEVVRISHSDTVQDMVRKGRECEKLAFSRSLEYLTQNRVFIYKNKTVVLL